MSEIYREPHERGTRRAWLVAWLAIVAVAAFLLRDGLFGGRVLLPFDALFQFEPWKSSTVEPVVPQNPLLLDQVTVIAPWLKFAADELHAGRVPLWNPNNYLGQPFLGTYQHGLFWPLNWPFLARPSWNWFAWMGLAKFALGGWFMLLYLRQLGLAPAVGAIGALAFALCGFQVVWLGHNQANVALLLPCLFWLIERMAQRPSARNAAGFGFAVAFTLFAGHPQTAAHVLIVVAAYALFRWRCSSTSRRLDARGLRWLMLGGLCGVLLAAPQILPFVEYLRESQGWAANARADLVTREGAWKGLLLLIAPRAFGAPHTHDYSGPLGQHLNYSELAGGFVGVAMLALALLGLLLGSRRGPSWFLLGLFAVALCGAYQLAPLYDGLRALPVLGATKLMRLSLFVAFALAVLGSLGLAALVERLARRPTWARLLPLGAFALVAVELARFGDGYNAAVDPALAAPRTAVTDFLIEKQRTEGPFRILAADGHALIANANLFYGLSTIAGYDSIELERSTDLIRALSSDERGQVLAQEIRWFDRDLPLGSLLGVRYLLSSKPLPEPFQLVLDGPCKVYQNPRALPRVFLASEIAVEADEQRLLERLSSKDLSPSTALVDASPPPDRFGYLDQALSTESLPEYGPTPEIVRWDSRGLRVGVHPDEPQLLVVGEAWLPGWTALTQRSLFGGRLPVVRVDHGLIGVHLDALPYEIEFRPPSSALRAGLWISAVALVMLLALLVRRSTP